MKLEQLKKAAKNGTLFYEKFGPSDGFCDACGKRGWSYLVAIIEKDEDVFGHIQNAGQAWLMGPVCFRRVPKPIKPFVSTY